jgi:hypothetical protein
MQSAWREWEHLIDEALSNERRIDVEYDEWW